MTHATDKTEPLNDVPCPRQCYRSAHCRRVTRSGKTYRCAEALAHEFGVTRSAVYQSLHRHGHAEVVGTPKGIPKGKGIGNHRTPVKIGPYSWTSISAMAKDLGVNRRSLGLNLRHNMQAVLGLVMKVKG